MRIIALFALLNLLACDSDSQQVPDPTYEPIVANPAFPDEQGPIVMVDQAHFNFHTAGERYRPFADLLRKDGYQVIPSGCPFSVDSLSRGTVLVISNALNERNIEDWSLPTPSAFTPDEIAAVKEWVEDGGSLLLIADHMPFPGAASDLAKAFGFTLNNGFAMKSTLAGGADYFRRSEGLLGEHAITRGRNETERIDSVLSFTGEAFTADSGATGLMIFGPGMVSLTPEEAWDFDDDTPRIPINGWFQGAVKEIGKGRVAVFGEAAMFTAQFAGDDHHPVGMNQPEASQNAQFLLNVMHWLTQEL